MKHVHITISLIIFLIFPSISQAKNILILNASSGLGQAIAEKLETEKDTNLVLTGRNLKKLDAFKGKKIKLDYTKPMQEFKSQIKDVALDGIVVITPRPQLGSHYLPEAQAWRQCFEEGFIGPLEALKSVIPNLKKGGKIVVIGGLTSVSALDFHQHYSVLRMMWLGQAKGLSRTLGEDEIHVNTIALGGTLTDSFMAGVERRAQKNQRNYEDQLKAETENIPLQRYAMPEEVANVTSFLLSKESNHINGVNIPMDGGFHRSY